MRELLLGPQAVQRPVTSLIAGEGNAGGLADTKGKEDASGCNVINLFMISSVTLEMADVWVTECDPAKGIELLHLEWMLETKAWRGGRTGCTQNPAKGARL